MNQILLIHILAGAAGLLGGYAALAARKGAPLHLRAGMMFVYAMLTMSVTGAFVAAVGGVAPAINVPVAAVTFYLVVTGMSALRPPSRLALRRDEGPPAAPQPRARLGMMLGLGAVLICTGFGVNAAASGATGIVVLNGIFGSIALGGTLGDLRLLRSGHALTGAPRLRRHLWRMSTALMIGAIAFFLGQADVFPEPVRIRPLLAMPVLIVPVTMAWWLWRVRSRSRQPIVAGAN